MDGIAQGAFVGKVFDSDRGSKLLNLPWRGRGFSLRPAGGAFNRVGLFANKPRATCDLPLPAGSWSLIFIRHGWSGHILVRDAKSYTFHDLYRSPSDTQEYVVDVISDGPETPISVELMPTRHPDTGASEVWLVKLRQSAIEFFPESGIVVSETCRIIEGKYGVFLALRTDCGVAEQLGATGVWEQEQVDLFHRLVRPGECVLDVGANIGHHSVVLSKLVGETGRVIAFEPQMQMFNLLNANLVLNRCRNVLPFKAAVGERASKLRMAPISYDDFQPFGSLGIDHEIADSGRGESIDVVCLDDFIPSLHLGDSRCSFIKVDVQSFELYVLKGARRLLENEQPSIGFEVAPYWMRRAGYDWRDITSLLESLGYDFFDDSGNALQIPEWDGESQAEWQFVAVSPRYSDRLK